MISQFEIKEKDKSQLNEDVSISMNVGDTIITHFPKNGMITIQSPIQYAYKNGNRDRQINIYSVDERSEKVLGYQELLNKFLPKEVKSFINFEQSLLLLSSGNEVASSNHLELQTIFLEVSQNLSYNVFNEKQFVLYGKTQSGFYFVLEFRKNEENIVIKSEQLIIGSSYDDMLQFACNILQIPEKMSRVKSEILRNEFEFKVLPKDKKIKNLKFKI